MSTVFVNGPVHTMAHTDAEWVVVDAGRIASLGTATPPAGHDVFDLDGRCLLPGFTDAHVHPPLGGLAMIRCDLHHLDTPAEYLAAVAAYAAANPHAEWILGGGWAMDAFPGARPPAAALDAVVPDRPVFLHSREGHAAWVNTRALEIAGVDAATPDPPDGRIERDEDGHPHGGLQEGAAALVERHAPAATVDDHMAAIEAAQAMLLDLGVTAWQDAWVTPAIHDAYLRLADTGRLRARVRAALWWERDTGVEQIETLLEASSRSARRFTPGTVKLMVDGVCENGTAAMLAPYEGLGSDGIQFISRETLLEAVPRLMAEGLQPHFHAIGDRAIRDALDAVAAARPQDVTRTRPHIAHIQVMNPADIPRFAALGVAANAQAYWACRDDCMTELTMPVLGDARTEMQYPFRSLRDSGARLVAGSDWSVSTANVFEQIHVAVTRRQPGIDEPFLEHQAITTDEMLRAFTAGSAWINHDDGRAGTIETGKDADLVVTDRDPLSTPPDELPEIAVDATFIAGELVSGS